MELQEGKEKFIEAWGALGSSWGVTRTMAQIHALLLVANDPLSTDDIMDELQISRGNVNINIRMLVDWGLAHKKLIPGERKEFFVGEKDMSKVVKNIIIARKKRELEPMLMLLDDLTGVQGDGPDAQEFREVIKDLKLYSHKADSALAALVKVDSNWFFSTFLTMIK
ncbi:DNA-binding transcriptional regulator GbsR (MarR family) [Lewinella marina]|uniref:HTH-type transcriptional regulator n=1 Tax=Neolewinella marina TaxID=438751 RepID=A0A2G0CFT5_9BACT|nr:MarR family transcriptional regulator [Neolewinella marina]NJB85455.1 DNA-binding transcriptional regulator GbsR (MarR family) [Neolewinella marina]PHK98854.1 transcriptional regulator [Neolewinella marina]